MRSMCLTLPLILHNLEKVYEILFKNLDLDDSWDFIITVIKDTRDESFEHILKRLDKLASAIGDGFSEKYFKKVFAVISTFYTSSIETIRQRIGDVWHAFMASLFQHKNKYLRKFSASSFRYILD